MIRVGTLPFICFPPQYSAGSQDANSALIESLPLPGKCPTYHFEWIKQEMDQIHCAGVLNVGFQLCLAQKNKIAYTLSTQIILDFLPFPVLTNPENDSHRYLTDG